MFFRRKKQPDMDQSVLTETLRSLEDLIAETPEPTPTDTGQTAIASEPPKASDKDHPDRENKPDDPRHSNVTEANQTPDIKADQMPDITEDEVSHIAVDDDVPVLTNVVYMPVPRVTAGEMTAVLRSASIDSAHQTIAKELINAVEDRLDTDGEPLDPALTQDLQDAVSASLEDWSIRTQEILLKRFTPPTKK